MTRPIFRTKWTHTMHWRRPAFGIPSQRSILALIFFRRITLMMFVQNFLKRSTSYRLLYPIEYWRLRFLINYLIFRRKSSMNLHQNILRNWTIWYQLPCRRDNATLKEDSHQRQLPKTICSFHRPEPFYSIFFQKRLKIVKSGLI